MRKVQEGGTPAAPAAATGEVQPGTEVKHARFGKGKVLKLEGNPPNVKATVLFPSAGQKQLLLKFAKLEIIK
jgi:DNA helicase-2/ATP-dependent DNA helicase PcrA